MGGKEPEIDLAREIENILKTNRRYFWDKGPLNHKRDKYIIIERILEFGTECEVDIIQNYYGIEAIKAVVIESRELSPRTVNYFSLLFGISRGETKCFSDVSQRIWQPY
ncbi:MAG: hypothetical protein ABIK98_14060 [Pseudomonadota bacterium]